MNLSAKGLDLIKRYEGYRSQAYKPVPTEKYWTIGYGHYGPDVKENMVITEAQGAELLRGDCASAEAAVNKQPYTWTQNEFDALVSFTYNCGVGNLRKLTGNGKRPKSEIAKKMLAYNKAGGKILNGLVRRRNEEQKLFLTGSEVEVKTSAVTAPIKSTIKGVKGIVNVKDDGSRLNVRASASTASPILETVTKGTVLYVQELLGDWYHITNPATGVNGFVHRKYLIVEG